MDFEVLGKCRTIDYPDKVLIKLLTRYSFGVRHRRMLNFDNDPCGCDDVCPMYFARARGMSDLPAFDWKSAFPFPMPWRFVFPPRVAISPTGVSPVMHHTRPALCNRSCATGWAKPFAPWKGFRSLSLDRRVLHGEPYSLAFSIQKTLGARFQGIQGLGRIAANRPARGPLTLDHERNERRTYRRNLSYSSHDRRPRSDGRFTRANPPDRGR